MYNPEAGTKSCARINAKMDIATLIQLLWKFAAKNVHICFALYGQEAFIFPKLYGVCKMTPFW